MPVVPAILTCYKDSVLSIAKCEILIIFSVLCLHIKMKSLLINLMEYYNINCIWQFYFRNKFVYISFTLLINKKEKLLIK